MPSRRECRPFTGATTRVTRTSSSRACASSPASHLSSRLSAAVSGSGKIRERAVVIGKAVGGPPHPRLEDRFQPPAQLAAQQPLERCATGQAQVRRWCCDLSFPFAAREEPRFPGRLDGLDTPLANPAHPEHQAVLAELLIVSVEIDRNFVLGLDRTLQGLKERKLPESRRARRRNFEL
jgi:hypothetical protein